MMDEIEETMRNEDPVDVKPNVKFSEMNGSQSPPSTVPAENGSETEATFDSKRSKTTPSSSRKGRGGGGSIVRGTKARRGRGGKRIMTSQPEYTHAYDYSLFSPAHFQYHHPDLVAGGSVMNSPDMTQQEARVQLEEHINNGYIYVSHAFELIRQSQYELDQARRVLRMGFPQNQVNGSGSQLNPMHSSTSPTMPMSSPNQGTELFLKEEAVWNDQGAMNEMVMGGDNRLVQKVHGEPDLPTEQFQVAVDPYQFMQSPEKLEGPQQTGMNAKRGRRRGAGPGSSRQRRIKGDKCKEFSNYSSKVALKGLRGLLEQLEDVKTCKAINRMLAIVLHDLNPALQKTEIKPKVFSAGMVEAYLNRIDSSNMHSEKGSETASDAKMDDIDFSDDDSKDSELFEPIKKQVSKSKLSNPACEELKGKDRKRKVPSASSSSDQGHCSEVKRPLWKQLRVDKDVIDRIKKRVNGQRYNDKKPDDNQNCSAEKENEGNIDSRQKEKYNKAEDINSDLLQMNAKIDDNNNPDACGKQNVHSNSASSPASTNLVDSPVSNNSFDSPASTDSIDSLVSSNLTEKVATDTDEYVLELHAGRDMCNCIESFD